jgi:hypothetical protein
MPIYCKTYSTKVLVSYINIFFKFGFIKNVYILIFLTKYKQNKKKEKRLNHKNFILDY